MTLLCSVFELRLQHTFFTAEQLHAGTWKSASLHEQEIALLQFCTDWLNQKSAYTFQTSGSTGTPKSVELTRAQLLASAAATVHALQLTDHDHALLCLSPATIAGSMMAMRAMLVNIPLTYIEPSVDILSQLSETHPYTFAAFVPAQLFEADKYSMVLNHFNTILIGGAALTDTLEHTLRKLLPRIYHTYGMTETASHIALREIHSQHRFHPLPGIELKTDERGCLCIKGDVTQQEWIVTNDVVELTTNGFTVKGRADYAINTGGVKVHPEEVERILATCEPLHNRHFFITGLPHLQWGQEVVLIVEGQTPLTESEWKMLCKRVSQAAGKYAVPKRYLLIHSFVMSTIGKINRPATINSLNV